MNKPKSIFPIAAFLFICLFALTNSYAQNPINQPEPSFEIVLQLVTASNNASDKTSIPQPLLNVVKKLKNDYSFSGYHLDATYLQRTSKGIQFKSIANASNQNQENFTPIFSEWTLIDLKSFPNAQGKNLIQFQGFNYGQRVPIRNSAGVINYEQIGLTLQKFSVSENIPTLVGSLPTAKPDEVMFLILTVRPAE